MEDRLLNAIDHCVLALESRAGAKWIIGFSGGKDSTATLKVVLSAWKRARTRPEGLELIYCDTGVENPILDKYVKSLFDEISREFQNDVPLLRCTVLKAPLHDRFLVKIVGRGYPPPNNNFRWCTNGLRIRPVSQYIQSFDPNNTVLVLGIRASESQQRGRVIGRQINPYWQKQTEGSKEYDIYAPLVELDTPEVWDAVFSLSRPKCVDAHFLEKLYRDASGECPIVKSPTAPPCASGRFGCWTCTVVRRDKSAQKLVDAGYEALEPYLIFRNWLASIRNDPERRWPTRRSGATGLGPFTLEARAEILHRIDLLEQRVQQQILDSDERGIIAGMWALDHIARLRSPKYAVCH